MLHQSDGQFEMLSTKYSVGDVYRETGQTHVYKHIFVKASRPILRKNPAVLMLIIIQNEYGCPAN